MTRAGRGRHPKPLLARPRVRLPQIIIAAVGHALGTAKTHATGAHKPAVIAAAKGRASGKATAQASSTHQTTLIRERKR